MYKKLPLLLLIVCFISGPVLGAKTETQTLESEAEYNPQYDSDSAQELNPYVEVEKNTPDNGKLFKNKYDDVLNFFLTFRFNNFTAKNRTSFNTFSFNTSAETDIGIEYTKYISQFTNFFGVISLNQYSMSEISTLNPVIDQSEKTQITGSLGGRYLYTESNFISYAINYVPHYYLTENSEGRLTLEHTPSTSVSFDTENQFFNNNEFIIALNLGFEYITNPLRTGSGSANGLGFNAAFIYQQDFKSDDKLRVKFAYSQVSLDSATHNLVDTMLSINFLYSLPY